jgi:hypothetical protein
MHAIPMSSPSVHWPEMAPLGRPGLRPEVGVSARGSLNGHSRRCRPPLVKAGEKLSHIDGTMIVSVMGGFADTLVTNTPTPAPTGHPSGSTLVGYARCSTDKQDLTAQRTALEGLGVASDRIYTDHGLSGTNRARPGLDQALAAVRAGDTLVRAQARPLGPLGSGRSRHCGRAPPSRRAPATRVQCS